MRSLALHSPLLAFCLALSLSSSGWGQDEDAAFKELFDGKTLEGWDGNPKFWSVEDGAITGRTTPENPTQGNTFIVWRGGEVEDFELHLKFRIFGGNSGIQYRSREVEKWVISGYQADFDGDNNWSGTLYEEKARGILARRGNRVVVSPDGPKVVGQTTSEEKIVDAVKPELWNDYVITARSNHLVHKINGLVTIDVTDEDPEKRRAKGLLALQLHAGPPMTVQFKDIRLKKLPKKSSQAAAGKKVTFVAGRPSHGYGAHEHNAGCLLLAKSLQQAMPELEIDVHQNGWPEDASFFEGTDCIVMYCDGGGRHMVLDHLDQVDQLADQGVGIVCIHYAVEIPKGNPGDHFLDWMGGYFETDWSVNPHWTANFTEFAEHPITRGVEPFEINDEWYYHMRFRENMEGVTPILTATPPASTLSRPDGPHSGNPHVRKKAGQPQHVAWAYVRPNGGRGFGFTGGHFHWNWGNDHFRRVMLNAIVWAAQGEVPAGGVDDKTPTQADLEANQDEPKPENGKQARTSNRQRPSVANVALKKKSRIAEASRDPGDGASQLDLYPGLKATLFASEPSIVSVTNLDVDARGRVWVCEVMNYRKHDGSRPEGDRILILEDTNQDGVADNTKVYYQGRDIDSAMGICVLGNRVIVSASPNVFVFTDEDGDDRPDRKEVLFSKTGQPQHDHSAHSFIFGPDGKLYWNFGNTGQAVHDAQGRVVVDKTGREILDNGQPYFGGMIFRCNLDGSEMEVLAHNFRNNYETTIDSFGTLWQADNDDDGNRGVRVNYVMEYGNYGYRDEMTGAGWREPRTGMNEEIPLRHWHLRDPGVVPNLLQTGAGSPAGIAFYEGHLLPEVFQNQIVHCDPGPSVVRAYPVQPDGAGYSAEIVNIAVGTRDAWFRPADVCVAPDGSLFVTDWYDPGVGGHNQGDLQRGRIYRIAPAEQRYQVPSHDFSTPEGAVEALKNPSLAVRYLAWTALFEQGSSAIGPLEKLWRDDNLRYRARALWLLGKIDGGGPAYVKQGLADKEPDIRITALRLARQLEMDVAGIVAGLADDTSLAVLRECAIALRGIPTKQAAELWSQLAEKYDGQDRWYLEALGIGAHGQWDACLQAWLDRVGDEWHSGPGRDIIWRSRAEVTPNLLAELITDPNTSQEDRKRFYRSLDFTSGQKKNSTLFQLALWKGSPDQTEAQRLINTEAVKRLPAFSWEKQPKLAEAVQNVLAWHEGTEQFVELVNRFRVASAFPALVGMLADTDDRQAAVMAATCLVEHQQQDLIRAALATDDEEQTVRIIQTLAASRDGRILPCLLPMVHDHDLSLTVRREVARAMAQTRRGAELLIGFAREDRLDPALREAVAAELNSARWGPLREEAAKLFPLPKAAGDVPVPTLNQLVRLRGDAQRGKKLFAATGTCAKCHKVQGQGTEIGPDLSQIGTKLSPQALYESILYPSAGISHNYEAYNLVTESGTVLSGLLVSQDASSVTLKTEDNIVHAIPRADIDVFTPSTVSLMPADLHKVLSVEQLADIVAYLQTLR